MADFFEGVHYIFLFINQIDREASFIFLSFLVLSHFLCLFGYILMGSLPIQVRDMPSTSYRNNGCGCSHANFKFFFFNLFFSITTNAVYNSCNLVFYY